MRSSVSVKTFQPRTFVPRALLYNDGGFDLSSDGKTLCACAELWLPDGVDNAMELLHKTVREYQAEILEEESLVKNHSLLPKCKKMSDSSSEPETQTLATVPLLGLKRTTESSSTSVGRSRSFRESMDQSPLPIGSSGTVPTTPQAASPEGHALNHLASSSGFIPRTPPVSLEPRLRNLSPPPPPGSRFMGRGIMRTREVSTSGGQPLPNQASVGISGAGEYVPGQGHPIGTNRGNPQPQPLPPGGYSMRPPHPLSIITATSSSTNQTNDILFTKGRYVPHVVTVSLDTSPIPEEARDTSIARGKPPGAVALGYRPRLGQLLEACPLDANKASAVTCVKFSPSTDFCLIGYGVREPVVEGDGNFHPVTTVYRVRGGMDHVSTMLSGDDDVNIARFHPDSGHSFVYGTKQGRVRVLSLRPWSFYDDFKREY